MPTSLRVNPSRVDIKTGFQCNNRCTFCVQGDKRFEYPDKTTDELMRVLDDARGHADQLVLTGGEVTLRKDLPELVAYARSVGFKVVQLQTNGRALSVERVLDRLVTAGVTEFAPALHGPSPAIHDAQTRAPGSFKQTVRGIRHVKARGLPVILNSVITRTNAPQLEAMAQLFVALHVDQFQLAFVHALGTAATHFDDVVPRMAEVGPRVRRALAIGRRAGVRCFTEGIPLCVLGSDARHAAEHSMPRLRIVDATWVIEDYTAVRVAEAKLHGPPCAVCDLATSCEGPWREYPEHFGWDEFVAVRRGAALGPA